jgi:hypothetical protein
VAWIVGYFARRQAKLGAIAAAGILAVVGILAAINYIASRENKRWDLTAKAQYAVRPDAQSAPEPRRPAARVRLRAGNPDAAVQGSNGGVRVPLEEGQRRVRGSGQEARAGAPIPDPAIRHRRLRVRAEPAQSTTDLTNGIIKAVTGTERKVYFTQGHGEKDTSGAERTGYSGIAGQLARDNYKVEAGARATVESPPMRPSSLSPAEDRLLPTKPTPCAPISRRGKCLFMIAPEKADARRSRTLALIRDWGMENRHEFRRGRQRLGQIFGTDASVPVAASYPSTPSPIGSSC